MNQLLYVGCVHCGQTIKELTDEEIVNILDEICGNDKYIEVLNMIIFARAILKKASER